MSRQFTERDAILKLQTYLRAQRLADPSFPSVPIDGIFDEGTKYALTEFQRRNSLPPTGRADRASWELLYAQYLEILQKVALPSPIIPFPSYPPAYELSPGEKSFLVATVQYMFNEIGIIYNVFEPLLISGEYDLETEALVRDFQERNLLPVTGRVDRKTWAALSSIYNLSLHYIDYE